MKRFLRENKGKLNKGFSLVEMVVIVSLLVIVSSATIIGVSYISGKPAQQAASKFSTLAQTDRNATMGKYKTELIIKQDSTGTSAEEYFYSDASGVPSNNKISKIADKHVITEFSLDNVNWTTVDAAGVTIEFDRGTGALKNPSSDVYFRFTKAGYNYIIRIYHLTGKVAEQ